METTSAAEAAMDDGGAEPGTVGDEEESSTGDNSLSSCDDDVWSSAVSAAAAETSQMLLSPLQHHHHQPAAATAASVSRVTCAVVPQSYSSVGVDATSRHSSGLPSTLQLCKVHTLPVLSAPVNRGQLMSNFTAEPQHIYTVYVVSYQK